MIKTLRSHPRPRAVLLFLAVVAIVVCGIAYRAKSEQQAALWTAEHAVPTVAVIHPSQDAANGDMTLPATLQPLNSAQIYPRTTGYVRKWFVSIGDHVKQGQLLAVLDAPDVQQQLDAAHADLQTARANLKLADKTAQRWRDLLASKAVSKQEADEKFGDLAAKTGTTNSAQATVARLKTLADFTKIVAPFDGVVTSRSIEIGALVTAGNTASTPLFTIADSSMLRAQVHVPQLYSALVHKGLQASLSLPEYPGRTFPATVERTAEAVDPSSGTLLVELLALNADATLKPGSYAQVIFQLPAAANVVTIPSSALMLSDRGPRVALIDQGGKAQLRAVTLGRDLGKVIEVTSGLAMNDAIIDNPPDSLQPGDLVRVASSGESKTGAPK